MNDNLKFFALTLQRLEEAPGPKRKRAVLEKALRYKPDVSIYFWVVYSKAYHFPITGRDVLRVREEVRESMERYPVRAPLECLFYIQTLWSKERGAREWAALIWRHPKKVRKCLMRLINRDLKCDLDMEMYLEVIQSVGLR